MLADEAVAPVNPLSSFRHVHTRSLAFLERSVQRFYPELRFELAKADGNLDAEASRCQLCDIALSYGRHGTRVRIRVPHNDTHALLFAFGGSAEARCGPSNVEVSGHSAFIASASRPVLLNYAADFEHLILNVSQRIMTGKLQALVGEAVGNPIVFKPNADLRRPATESLRQQFMFLASQLERQDGRLHQLALAELEQAIVVTFLTANDSNYSLLLTRPAPLAGDWQVQKAEAYVEANWDQPLTVETLAFVSGVSARTLFHSFRRHRGYSPMEFVKRIRLERARQMLADADRPASVTSVAFACGFGNLGHFAGYYRRAFGESPSATLQRSRGPIQGLDSSAAMTRIAVVE